MRTHTLPILTAGLILLALPTQALPADDASQDIPITDPALLESWGFESDATNVYATEQALRRMAMSPAERAAADEELLAATEVASSGGPYGLNDGFTIVSQRAFRATFSDAVAPTRYNSTMSNGLYCIGGSHTYEAQVEPLPHGARLTSVQAFVYDNSAENITAWLRRTCNSTGPNVAPTFTLLDQGSTVGSPTFHGLLLNAGGVTINNQTCEYWVQVRLDDGDASTCSELADLRLYKARAGWQRQVSPAPVTATFNDVPTGHPFFQHIEALAASKVTSGCDANNFCPNAPLNRGQMAVFLAKALGLHWGSF